jgi:hypothetical protein
MPAASTGGSSLLRWGAMKLEPAAIEPDDAQRRPHRQSRPWLRRLCVPAFFALALLGLHAADAAAGNPLEELGPLGAAGGAVEAVTETAGPLTDPVLEATAPVTSEAPEAVAPVVTPVRDAAEPVVEVAAPAVDTIQPVIEPVEPVVEPVRDLLDPVIGAETPVTDAVAPVLPSLVDEVVDPDPASATVSDGRHEATRAHTRPHLVEADARAGLPRLARQAAPEPPTVAQTSDAQEPAGEGAPASGTETPAHSGSTPWRAPAAEPAALGTFLGGHAADPAIAAMLASIAAMACLAVTASAFLQRRGLVPAPPVPPG